MERLSNVMRGMAGSEETPPVLRDALKAAQQGDEPMNAKTQEIMPREDATSALALTPMDMLDRAVANGASIEVLTKLMDLQERFEKNQARKAFDKAIAEAKAEIPIVRKTSKGHNSKLYADFAAFALAVDPIITKHGLSYRFRTTQDDRIHVTCVLSHSAGHSEENTLAGPSDTTGNKNAIQAIGSTLTYLQRYSLVQALGLAASEDDDGRAGGIGDTVSDEQVSQMRSLIVEAGLDLPQTLEFFKVERLEDMAASRFDWAMKLLLKRAEKAKTAEPA